MFMGDSITEFWLTMHPNAAGYLIMESILKEQLKNSNLKLIKGK